jgi:ABC-2 type transport system ATP-binding protein
VGQDTISLKTEDNDKAAEEIKLRYQIEVTSDGGGLTFAVDNGEEFLPDFIKELSTKILSVNLRRPSLDDVFLKLTGREIRDMESDDYKSIAHHGRFRRH